PRSIIAIRSLISSSRTRDFASVLMMTKTNAPTMAVIGIMIPMIGIRYGPRFISSKTPPGYSRELIRLERFVNCFSSFLKQFRVARALIRWRMEDVHVHERELVERCRSGDE